MKIGIISYGTYIPRARIALGEIALAWRKNPDEIIRGLGVREKSVPAVDEDTVTVAIEAASHALLSGNIDASQIDSLLIGSESHPYAVNPTSTIVGEFLGVGRSYFAADLEFACKAGTAGIILTQGLLSGGNIQCGMVIGADTAQGRPHDVLEYTASSVGVAFIMGKKDVIVELVDWASYSSDTPDFWRRDGMRYPVHAGRFTGEPAYFTHVMGAGTELLKKSKKKPKDFTYAVFHMPNGKFPKEVAKRFGFTDEQIAPSLTVTNIGNPYSASSMLGLSAVLDIAKPGQLIFMVSYGSGAGSDAFIWKVTDKISSFQKQRKKECGFVSDQIRDKRMISYVEYLQQTKKI
jgi:hydroxymethylglutaryl-CoA synthase